MIEWSLVYSIAEGAIQAILLILSIREEYKKIRSHNPELE